MYRYFVILAIIFLFACTQKEEGLKLTENSKEYKFAKELASKLPKLDPDENIVLVETNRFDISTGDVFDALFKNFSGDVDKLKNVDTMRVKKIFNENASLMAEKKMIITTAFDEGFEVSQTELDSVLQIQYDKAGGKEKFEKFMQNRNIDLDYIYEDYKNSLLIRKLLKSLAKDSINISNEEIQNKLMAIKAVTVRHILLSTAKLDEPGKKQKRRQLEQILKKAKSGDNFSDLAQIYSDDTGTAKNGGLIKNIKPGDMVQPFDNIAFSLAIGEISDVFETPFGYHILTVIDRVKENRSAGEIKKELYDAKQKQLLPNIINNLKKQYEFTEIKL